MFEVDTYSFSIREEPVSSRRVVYEIGGVPILVQCAADIERGRILQISTAGPMGAKGA